MGKIFASASSLWVLFIPLLSVSKVGIVDLIDDGHDHSDNDQHDVILLIKQLGELKESGLITKEEFESKKKRLLNSI